MMKNVYFRDDQMQVKTWHLAPATQAGVTFGKLSADDSEPTWRAVWRGAAPEWALEFMYPGWDKMEKYPQLYEALKGLPTTASIDDFCGVLEQVGFVNAR